MMFMVGIVVRIKYFAGSEVIMRQAIRIHSVILDMTEWLEIGQ